jgi:hypothetical protein
VNVGVEVSLLEEGPDKQGGTGIITIVINQQKA